MTRRYLRHKLSWSLATVGPLETLRGLLRLRHSSLTTREGITLSWKPAQRPTLLVVAGRYVDPEYTYLASRVQPSWNVVDVGAGIGMFSLYMAKLGATVIAYEPDPYNVGTLVENIAANDVAVGWRPHALGSVNDGVIRLSMRGLDTTASPQGGLEAIATTLDSEYPVDEIDLLKVNTAGSEHDVLLGATRLFLDRRVRTLVVLDSMAVRIRLLEIESYGYRIFTPDQKGNLHDWPIKPRFSRHVLAERIP